MDGKKWLEIFETACRQLQQRGKKAAFIMDNASYHKTYGSPGINQKYWPGRTLSSALRQQLLECYLKDNKIRFERYWNCDYLRDSVRHHLRKDGTRAEQVAAICGHEILLTPLYWPQLQPMEEAWDIVKKRRSGKKSWEGCIDADAEEQTLLAAKAAFKQVTPAVWERLIDDAYQYGRAVREEITKRARALTQGEESDMDSEEFSEESDNRNGGEEY